MAASDWLAGGMERPRDDYKDTHNVQLATRDKLFGGQVSRLQVAELISEAVANPTLAQNKVLEVVADTTAPSLSYQELLARHPAGKLAGHPQAGPVWHCLMLMCCRLMQRPPLKSGPGRAQLPRP